MQVIINKDFTIATVEPSAVYQNSSNAAYISIFAPFKVSSFAAIEANFTLPNGERLSAHPALGVPPNSLEQSFGVWSIPIDARLTEIAGTVRFSILFIGAVENGSSVRQSTGEAVFEVLASNLPAPPSESYIHAFEAYEEKLSALLNRFQALTVAEAQNATNNADKALNKISDVEEQAIISAEKADEATKSVAELKTTHSYIMSDIEQNQEKIASLRKYVENLQYEAGDVGRMTEQGGEIFNDYEGNVGGSMAYGIVGVHKERTVTEAERINGYDGIYEIPTAAEELALSEELIYHSDFSGASNEKDGTKYVLDGRSGLSGTSSYIEDRIGGSVLKDGELTVGAVSSGGKYKASVNLQLLDNNVPVKENSGRSFVFSADIRAGEKLSAGTLFEIRCTLKTGDTVSVRPLSVDGSGNLKAGTSVIGKLDTSEYKHVVYAADVEKNTVKIYINGANEYIGTFLSDTELSKIKSYAGFESGFALSSIGFYRETNVVGELLGIRRLSLYFADGFKFGLGGYYELDGVRRLNVGDEYSVHVNYASGTGHGGSEQRENYGRIIRIEGNRVYVDKLFCSGEFEALSSYSAYSDLNTFRVISKPDAGSRRIGLHSHVGGKGNSALSKGGMSFGSDNVSFGSWSGTVGRELKAGYSAFACNGKNSSMGQNSFSCNMENEVEAQAFGGFAAGRGNVVSGAYEAIFGEYAKKDEYSAKNGNRGEYLFKVGNGTGDGSRSDAFAVGRDGNVYAGEKKLATEEYVNKRVADLVDSAPETLDTLKELSAALDNDEHFSENLWKLVYPVGAIYMSTSSTSPSVLFGGTWERIKDRFLLASGDSYAAGSEGGQSSVMLNGSHIPSHVHGVGSITVNDTAITGSFLSRSGTGSNNIVGGESGVFSEEATSTTWKYPTKTGSEENVTVHKTVLNAAHGHGLSGSTASYGSGTSAVPTVPPYLAVYVWVRRS